jgi:Tfp pilus assembly protein PilW
VCITPRYCPTVSVDNRVLTTSNGYRTTFDKAPASPAAANVAAAPGSDNGGAFARGDDDGRLCLPGLVRTQMLAVLAAAGGGDPAATDTGLESADLNTSNPKKSSAFCGALRTTFAKLPR